MRINSFTPTTEYAVFPNITFKLKNTDSAMFVSFLNQLSALCTFTHNIGIRTEDLRESSHKHV